MSLQLLAALHYSLDVHFDLSFVIQYTMNHQNHYVDPVCQFVIYVVNSLCFLIYGDLPDSTVRRRR